MVAGLYQDTYYIITLLQQAIKLKFVPLLALQINLLNQT